MPTRLSTPAGQLFCPYENWTADIVLQTRSNFAAPVGQHRRHKVVLISWIDLKCGLICGVQSFRATNMGSLVSTSDPTWRGKGFVGKQEAGIHKAKSHLRCS